MACWLYSLWLISDGHTILSMLHWVALLSRLLALLLGSWVALKIWSQLRNSTPSKSETRDRPSLVSKVISIWHRTHTRETEQARATMQRLKELQKPPDDARKGYARLFGIFTTILVMSWTLSGVLAVRDHQKIRALEAQLAKYDASTVMEHHVEILAELDNGDFAYISDEKPKGDTWRVCSADMKNGVNTADILRQGIGYIADYAIWEERGTCKSILRADLGFWWKDADNKFKYARSR